MNLDPSDLPGSHWCAVYFDKGLGSEYYDPLGFPPQCEAYLRRNAPDGVVYNDHQIQDVLSISCGEFCIDFVKRRLAGESFCEILSSYSRIPLFNDWMV